MLITVTLNASSHNDLKHSTDTILYQLEQTRKKMNGGSSFKVSSTDPHNSDSMMQLMGRLKWWSLDREAPSPARKSFWSRMADELNGIFEEEGPKHG